MKKESKIYDRALKMHAVTLSNERSNISELARELRIRPTGYAIQSSILELEFFLSPVNVEIKVIKTAQIQRIMN